MQYVYIPHYNFYNSATPVYSVAEASVGPNLSTAVTTTGGSFAEAISDGTGSAYAEASSL